MLITELEVPMFTSHLDVFKTEQKVLHRQAAEYRLARSLARPAPWAARIYLAAGRTLIASGQELKKHYPLAG